MSEKKIVTLQEFLDLGRGNIHMLVTTNGCFDILGYHHVRLFEQIHQIVAGPHTLVVLINSDDSVQDLKGPGRPINTWERRAEVVAGLERVDYVIEFGEETPIEILGKIQPDIHVKGGDYQWDQIVEREIVEKHGGICIFLPPTKDKYGTVSTSRTINKIQRILSGGEKS